MGALMMQAKGTSMEGTRSKRNTQNILMGGAAVFRVLDFPDISAHT